MRRLRGTRLRVRLRDRHRSDRPSHRAQAEGRRDLLDAVRAASPSWSAPMPLPCCPKRNRGAWWWRATALPCCWAWARRELRRLRHRGAAAGHARLIYLEDGDVAEIARWRRAHRARHGSPVDRPCMCRTLSARSRTGAVPALHAEGDLRAAAGPGQHPGDDRPRRVLAATVRRRRGGTLFEARFVLILACGTSFHAGLVARYWIEGSPACPARRDRQRVPLSRLRCRIRRPWSSPFRNRARPPTRWPRCKHAKSSATVLLSICNVPESAWCAPPTALPHPRRPEIGVASTKAFTTQLAALAC
jgi:hypothetical protein